MAITKFSEIGAPPIADEKKTYRLVSSGDAEEEEPCLSADISEAGFVSILGELTRPTHGFSGEFEA